MKNSKLLNKNYLLIILFSLFFDHSLQSQEPADIWNSEEKIQIEEDVSKTSKEKSEEIKITESIYKMQTEKINQKNVEEDQTLVSREIEIIGLYDPAENGLSINMWSNSEGDQILNIFERINKMNLSNDASEILDILFLTNSYYPERNISKEQFQEIKSKWL
ncbi:hypothetical protein N9S39_04750, partial [Candidatus Pelagibacter sp.]|nr:hypothetical protein [Candidatus Pelagibacter sp.]